MHSNKINVFSFNHLHCYCHWTEELNPFEVVSLQSLCFLLTLCLSRFSHIDCAAVLLCVSAELYSICLSRAKEKWRNTPSTAPEIETEGKDRKGNAVHHIFWPLILISHIRLIKTLLFDVTLMSDQDSLVFLLCSFMKCHVFQMLVRQIGSRVWSWSSWTSLELSPNCVSSSRSVIIASLLFCCLSIECVSDAQSKHTKD